MPIGRMRSFGTRRRVFVKWIAVSRRWRVVWTNRSEELRPVCRAGVTLPQSIPEGRLCKLRNRRLGFGRATQVVRRTNRPAWNADRGSGAVLSELNRGDEKGKSRLQIKETESELPPFSLRLLGLDGQRERRSEGASAQQSANDSDTARPAHDGSGRASPRVAGADKVGKDPIRAWNARRKLAEP